MAKFCEVCKQPYPDDKAACPHCATRARETVNLAGPSSDAPGKAPGTPPAGPPSDSAVDLGQPLASDGSSEQPLDLSGVSAIEWAALVEEPASQAQPSSSHFDSPSDIELLSSAGKQPAPETPKTEVPAAQPPAVPAAAAPMPPAQPEAPKSPLLASAGSLPPPAGASKHTMLASAAGARSPSSKETMLAPPGPPAEESGPKATMLAPSGTLPEEAASPKQTMLASGDVVLPTGDPKATMLAAGSVPHDLPATGAHVDSGVDLAEAGQAPPEPAGLPTPSGSSRVDLTADVPSSEVVSESGIDLVQLESREPGFGAAEPVAPDAATGPGVDLREVADARPEVPAAGPPAGTEFPESGIDLVTLESSTPPGAATPTVPPLDVSASVPPPDVAPLPRRGVTETRIELTPPTAEAPAGPTVGDAIAQAMEAAGALGSGAERSKVDVGQAQVAHTGDTPPSSALDLGRMNFPLEEKAAGSPSAAESGIDVEVLSSSGLGSKKTLPDSGESGIDVEVLGGSSRRLPGDSRVDLGSSPEIDASISGVKAVAADSDVALESAAEAEVAEEAEEAVDASLASEVAVEAEEEEEERPKRGRRGKEEKKEKKRGSRLLVGSVLGILIGVGTALGLWLFGIEPPKQWRELVGTKGPAKTDTGGPPVAVVPARPPAEAQTEAMRDGDFDKAAKAGVEAAPETDGAALERRGEHRWLVYLQDQASAEPQKPIKATDEPVKLAREDLNKAIKLLSKLPDPRGSRELADAYFTLGMIEQYTGEMAQAKSIYAKGADTFKAVPEQKQRFESALISLELEEAPRPAGAARAFPARAVLALLIALEAPPGAHDARPGVPGAVPPRPRPAVPEVPEAGIDFLNALRQARAQDYSKALTSLQRARDRHNRRRFLRQRKPQNPLSDPMETIFLRSADEIRKYWEIEGQLKKEELLNLTDKRDPVKAVAGLITEVKSGGAVVKALAAKLVKAKVITKPEDFARGVEQLLEDRDTDRTKITALEKAATADKTKITKLEGDLKTANDTLKTAKNDLKKADTRITSLEKDKTRAEGTLKEAADVLVKAKYLDEKKVETGFLPALKMAVDTALTKDPGLMLMKLKTAVAKAQAELKAAVAKADAEVKAAITKADAEVKAALTKADAKVKATIARTNAELKERWRPEQMLAFWMPLLQLDRTHTDLAANAKMDVDRVLKDPKATPAQKGQAELVRGLALRNEDKFDDAKKALLTAGKSLDGEWLARATLALKEVSDPAAYFLGRATTLRHEGKPTAALAILNQGIKAVVDGNALLMAHRSLLELDDARGRFPGLLPATDPMVLAALKDAKEAAKAKLAEGHFALGRVQEEMGKWDDAIKNYQDAMDAHPAKDADYYRYSIAKARVLVRPREPGVVPGAPKAPEKVKPPETKVGRRIGRLVPRLDGTACPSAARRSLLMLVVLAFEPAGLPGEPSPAVAEAERLADEILKAPAGTVPFDVRAQALAVKGLYTQALRTYVSGLRPLLREPRYADELVRLVERHPLLRRPESLAVPSPLAAEKHYAAGLSFYFARDYANAEKAFLAAVENDKDDARYFYFLGLARMAQGKRDYSEDFEQGARLEQEGRPSPAAVSISLERVQGAVRRTLNEARNRPR